MVDAYKPDIRQPDASRCAYCGAALNPHYYFCTSCATPWQDIERVLPAEIPRSCSTQELMQTRAPGAFTVFWAYLIALILAVLISSLVDDRQHPGVALMISAAFILVLTCVFSVIHWPVLAVQFRRLGLLTLPALAGLAALAPLLLINYVYHELFLKRGLEAPSAAEGIASLDLSPGALFFLLCVFPAVTEEIAFRGLVQQWLQVALKPRRAVIVAAALFAAMHLSILSAPYLFLVGLLLGWVKLKTNSLYPSMLIHFAHNFFALEFMAG